MIKQLYIDNFKALNNFTIKLKPLTVLIGENASGKTSVIQAINLMLNLVKIDLDNYIKSRNWSIGDMKSQLSGKKNITFIVTFEFKINDNKNYEIEWEFIFNPVIKDEKIYIRNEKITNITTSELLLEVNSQGIMRYNEETKEKESIPPLNLTASFIKNIDELKDINKYPILACIKKFLIESDSFDLLLPDKLSQNSRGKVDTIGYNGQNLAAFIHGLGKDQQKKLEERLRKYLNFVSKINTKKEGKGWGWIKLSTTEVFLNNIINVKSYHLSEGTLRMIAIASLAEINKKSGIILLEEIENGINPNHVEILSHDLQDISKLRNRQIILTTHNSVLLDYFPEDSIVFLWRNEDGTVNCGDMFAAKILKEQLEYMYPGEVWLNMNNDEIINNLKSEKNICRK
ncbi:AAA ATPase-like domain-containing protein [Desulfonema limicola]|uniref:AAA ATPase-like domain-containing protein n=1 Tax=Desulfonema limicola TaxID=45656 RepID=A0A975B6C6_9BACT|nr:ATP-binding protein [Desulfonema limicola]QTA79654.1 AAA ATPase-like domain-containing protein [Desulfonema limicola]